MENVNIKGSKMTEIVELLKKEHDLVLEEKLNEKMQKKLLEQETTPSETEKSTTSPDSAAKQV